MKLVFDAPVSADAVGEWFGIGTVAGHVVGAVDGQLVRAANHTKQCHA